MSGLSVLLTRPQAQSEALAEKLRREGYSVLIEPMLALKKIHHAQADFQNYQGVIATSLHAWHAVEGNAGIPVYAVGGRTSAEARKKGFENIRAATATVADLIDVLKKQNGPGPFLYLRGADVSADLTAHLPHLNIEENIVYAMEKVSDFSKDVSALLRTGRIGAVLFFSRRTARNFVDLAEKTGHLPDLAAIKALCLSPGMIECLEGAAWAEIHAAGTPDEAGILEKLYGLQGLKKQP